MRRWLYLLGMAATINLAWEASQGATSYRVYYGRSSGHYQTVLDVGPAITVSVGGLSGGHYYFAVTAINDAGESDYSNEVRGIAP
jgi:hypothetical protein